MNLAPSTKLCESIPSDTTGPECITFLQFLISNNYSNDENYNFFRLESDKSVEAGEAMRNLVLMVSSLAMCGQNELKPSQASTGSLFQMGGFTLPQPSGKGLYFPSLRLSSLYLLRFYSNWFIEVIEK